MDLVYPYAGVPDLRTIIAPGDVLIYVSAKEADKTMCAREMDAEGTVVSVYPAFAIVRLRAVEDTANRWNIKAIRKGH